MAMNTSPLSIMPRSPWLASAGWTKYAGVPVLESVEAILRAMCPDLPMPLTTTRPLRFCTSSTAARKRSSMRSASARTASASICSTLRASSSILLFVGRAATFIIRSEYSPMDSAAPLRSVLVLLASAVVAVALCRSLHLPPIVGYLAAGIALGPHAAGLLSNREEIRHLADFGVVFLMFSIGLEFSLSRLISMRRIVFGFGAVQVLLTLVLALGGAWIAGYAWQTGVALGAVAAMASTAIASNPLTEPAE